MFWKKCSCVSKLTEEERIKAWSDGFNMAMSKSWDLLMPFLTGNIEVLKKKIYDDATMAAVKRMNPKND